MQPGKIVIFVIATALSIIPQHVSAQVVVTMPATGAQSSYRTATISWNPIPGATSYHLEIDDDPNFGSPEVDVTVPGTSYTPSGQRLKLHGQLSWAAYVRINGMRWTSGGFTPSYFHDVSNPALAVDSLNRVYLAFTDIGDRIELTTSSDWSSKQLLSLADTFNTYGLNLAVDENDVAHASWMEQRPAEAWVPYYTNSSTGWNLVRIPGTISGGCSEGSLVVGGGQIDLFYEDCGERINHWTGTNGLTFTRTTIPNNPLPNSANAARDGFGNIYVASDRYVQPLEDLHSALQISADGWQPHRLGPGRFPSIAVTPSGEVHALRWAEEPELGSFGVFYSNSLRDFQTWTGLPVIGLPYFDQDLLPLVLDNTRNQLHAAVPSGRGVYEARGLQVCSTPLMGQATGTTWACSDVGNLDVSKPDLALASDGTLHVAWSGHNGVGYANSLGSFLATNFAPQVNFGAVSSTPSAAIVPTTVSDADGDDLSGEIQVGRLDRMISRLWPGAVTPFLQGIYSIQNVANSYLAGSPLQFRPMDAFVWDTKLSRNQVTQFPAMIEVRHSAYNQVGVFIVLAWNDEGVAIAQSNVVPQITQAYAGTLPSTVNISTLSDGDAVVLVKTSDGSSPGIGMHPFTKAPGQTSLVLKP